MKPEEQRTDLSFELMSCVQNPVTKHINQSRLLVKVEPGWL